MSLQKNGNNIKIVTETVRERTRAWFATTMWQQRKKVSSAVNQIVKILIWYGKVYEMVPINHFTFPATTTIIAITMTEIPCITSCSINHTAVGSTQVPHFAMICFLCHVSLQQCPILSASSA